MGANLGTEDDKKNVNVDLNIVPYIDLMSCLTAFLLVVAVWVNLAQITIQPKGRARGGTGPDPEIPKISVLMQRDAIYVGVANMAIDPTVLKRAPGEDFDWDAYEATLRALKKESELAERTDLEIAAESTNDAPVAYGYLAHAMDIAVRSGFPGVSLFEPTGLSWRPTF